MTDNNYMVFRVKGAPGQFAIVSAKTEVASAGTMHFYTEQQLWDELKRRGHNELEINELIYRAPEK